MWSVFSARIYHCILRHNTTPQQRLFTGLAVFLIGMNVAVYTTTVLEYFSTAGTRFIPEDMSSLMLSVVCFVVALLFLLYGTLLYLECQRVIREASATPQQSHAPGGVKYSGAGSAAHAHAHARSQSSHSKSSQVGEVASALGRSTGLAPPATPSPPGTNNSDGMGGGNEAPTIQPNPMRKVWAIRFADSSFAAPHCAPECSRFCCLLFVVVQIAIIAAVCTLCLTVRTILIPTVVCISRYAAGGDLIVLCLYVCLW